MKLFYATAMALVVGAASYMLWTTFEPTVSAGTTSGSDDTALVKVILPDSFSDKAKVGQVGFNAKCAACHGVNAAGKDGVAPHLFTKSMNLAITAMKAFSGPQH